jgi:hypothetical protein
MIPLDDPIPLRLADGNLTNDIASISTPIRLVLNTWTEDLTFYVTDLNPFDIVLGHSWLYQHNPRIDWNLYTVQVSDQILIGRAQGAHRNFRPEPTSIRTCELNESIAEDTYPFLRPRPTDGQQYPPPEYVVKEFGDIFDEEKANQLPPVRDYDVRIPLKPGAQPHFSKVIKLSQEESRVLKEWLDKMESTGRIQQEASEYAAPVFFVKQKGKLRTCIDYRRVNADTIKKKFPIPLIEELIRNLSKARVYTALDLKSAYHQLRVCKEDVPKTGFITPFGQYTSNVVLFGSTNAPGDFQYFMTQVFKKYLNTFVLVYLDDIIIYSENPEEHETHVRLVLELLREHSLFCNLEKCQFNMPSVNYLGYVISPEGIFMDESKIKSILDWPTPTTPKQIKSFLGFTNFYRKFIPKYAELSLALNLLLKKNAPFKWGEKQESSFLSIKNAFKEAGILNHPNESREFIIETDASDFAIAGVLSQEDDNGLLRPVCFYSRKLAQAEVNYEIYDRELLAIVSCFKEWRHYLQASDRKTTVYCDHKNLTYFRTSKILSGRHARWSLFLEEFNYVISYRPGKENVKPDLLSRRSDYQETEAKREKILLPQERFEDLLTTGNPILVPSNDSDVYSDVLDTNINLQNDWPLVIAHFFEDHEWLNVPDQFLRKCRHELPNFTVKSNQLYRILDDKISTAKYVPHGSRVDLLKRFHEGLGHLKLDSIKDLFSKRYWWPNWLFDLKIYIRNCPECQLDESNSKETSTPLRPIPPVGLPFERWGIDFIQDLPETKSGNKHIITAIDYATRWVVAKAVPERTSSEMVKFLYENILMNYGCPYEVFSDRASALLSQAIGDYMELQNIRHKATTPYHPKTNGMVERMHAMVGHSITTLSQSQPDRWDEFLNQTIFAIRVRSHAVTRYSPFYLLYGVDSRIPGDTDPPRESMTPWTSETLNDFQTRNLEQLQRARGIAYMRSVVQAEKMKQRFNDVENSPDYFFKINDWVKMKRHNSNKFEFEWKGPYFVVDVGFPGTYWLMEPNGRRLDSTVNQSDLAPWRSSVQNNQSFFHDGTLRSTVDEQELAPLSLNASTLSVGNICSRNMGDCVTVAIDSSLELNTVTRSVHPMTLTRPEITSRKQD